MANARLMLIGLSLKLFVWMRDHSLWVNRRSHATPRMSGRDGIERRGRLWFSRGGGIAFVFLLCAVRGRGYSRLANSFSPLHGIRRSRNALT